MGRIPLKLVEAIVLLAMTVVGLVEGALLIVRRDPYALYDKIGPGRSLMAISLLLMIAVITYIIRERKSFYEEKHPSEKKRTLTKEARAIGTLVIYVVLIDIVGFLPATVIFLFLVLRLLGVRSWLSSTLLSIVFSVIIYLVFVQALNMELPRGLFLD